jgi:hypothetical protein
MKGAPAQVSGANLLLPTILLALIPTVSLSCYPSFLLLRHLERGHNASHLATQRIIPTKVFLSRPFQDAAGVARFVTIGVAADFVSRPLHPTYFPLDPLTDCGLFA